MSIFKRTRLSELIKPITSCGLVAVFCGYFFLHLSSVKPKVDSDLKDFTRHADPSRDEYIKLSGYFLRTFISHQSQTGESARYPGRASTHGTEMDGLEGFCRLAPLAAIYCLDRPSDSLSLKLVEALRRGLLTGTNPSQVTYWGRLTDNSQSIVEAADVALTIWMLRNSLWKSFSTTQKVQLVAWLSGINRCKVPDNNWHLFIVLTNEALNSLGYGRNATIEAEHYARVSQFYKPDGWFEDGPSHHFDYYNAWGIYYALYWIDQINPKFDPINIHRRLDRFCGSYKYLISTQGVPIVGRSVCYRLAVAAPLIMNISEGGSTSVSYGEAKRALDATWSYYISKGAVKHGQLTQGYCGTDTSILDDYTGPASCFWGLRSLIVALSLPDNHPFWNCKATPLPVEIGSYTVHIKSAGWTIVGEAPSKITIFTKNAPHHISLLKQLKNFIHSSPDGSLEEREYGSDHYSNSDPFCGCKETD